MRRKAHGNSNIAVGAPDFESPSGIDAGAVFVAPQTYREIELVPGIPLAIARPDAQVMLIEATKKKAAFLKSAVESLGAEVHPVELVVVAGDKKGAFIAGVGSRL